MKRSETTGTSTNKGFRPGRGGGNPAICGSCDPPGRTRIGALVRWLALAGLASPPANLHGPSGTRISSRPDLRGSKFITRSNFSPQGPNAAKPNQKRTTQRAEAVAGNRGDGGWASRRERGSAVRVQPLVPSASSEVHRERDDSVSFSAKLWRPLALNLRAGEVG